MKRVTSLLLLLCTVSSVHCIVKFINDAFIEPNGRKTALIFGITGQDGIYLSEFLLEKEYVVYGVIKNGHSLSTEKFLSLFDSHEKEIYCILADITDVHKISQTISLLKPQEIYNLAAQSMVKASFEYPIETAHINGMGTLYILEAIRLAGLEKEIKFYQASSSEMFGKGLNPYKREDSPFYPRSPYGVSKLFAYWMCVNYREAYNMFISNGILFNHESPYRGEHFVTRIIAHNVAKIKLGLAESMKIGNLNAQRDWGYAQDYVRAMWLMLQQDEPGDYIISTGHAHSVRQFLEMAFKEIGIEIIWQGRGVDEIGIDKKSGKELVTVDPKLFRPTEIDCLVGDSSKAKTVLGWSHSLSFKELVSLMVNHEINILKEKERT